MSTGRRLLVETDGASRGNPGFAGVGVIIKDETGKTLETIGKFLGISTNNQAEYQALITALEAVQRYAPEAVTVHSDSELMVKQINGQYRVRHPEIIPLFQQAIELATALPSFTIIHVPREKNPGADRVANVAIDSRGRRVALD